MEKQTKLKIFLTLILLFFLQNLSFSQSWLKYYIPTQTQTTLNYILSSGGQSALIPGNRGVLNENFSSDTARQFFPLDLINDANASPWRAIVKVGGVSGVLIDPYHVLTAGHIIEFNYGFGTTKISPGYFNADASYGSAYPVCVYIPSDFATGTPTDIGIIELDRPIGALTGWTGYGFNSDDSYFTSNIFFNPSYPAYGLYDGEMLYNWKGKFNFTDADFFYSIRIGIVGMSGSAAFLNVNNQFITYGFLLTSGLKFNRITAAKYDAINAVINSNTPSSFDLIPLFTNISPKIVESGHTLDSLSFVLHNYSSVNYNNANITAKVYISSDSVITSSDELLATYYYTKSFTAKSSQIILQSSYLPAINKPVGTYYIGLIISGDSDSTNNITKGFDVAKIIVNGSENETIIGYITSTQTNNGISGVKLNGFPNQTYTDYKGYYETQVPKNWSGTVTPVRTGYEFSSGVIYRKITENTVTNYTGAKKTFTVSGSVKSPVSHTGVMGVKASGLVGEPVSDINGNYSSTVYYGWCGSVGFLKTGWTTNPQRINYNQITANKNENIQAGFSVKGTCWTTNGVQIPNVNMTGFPGNVLTDSVGRYEVCLDSGWIGTVKPVKPNMEFTPESRTYSGLNTSFNFDDYTEYAPIILNLKVFLSGAYSENSDTMKTTLNYQNQLPLIPPDTVSGKINPFIYKMQRGDTLPPSFWTMHRNIVDWLILEIRTNKNFASVDTVAALLRKDGRVLSLAGDTLVPLGRNVASGSYYVVVRHRNHIAVMSSFLLSIGINSNLYSFTISASRYYGGQAKLLKTGLYGMYAGDATYDGYINEGDFSIYNAAANSALFGYQTTDFNLDGYVTARDFNLFAPNNRNYIMSRIP